MSDKPVKKWSAYFRAGHESLVDDLIPGQANTVIIADLIDKMDDLVRSDCHITLRMLLVKMDVSIGTMWIFVHYRLCYWKVYMHWVLKQLAYQKKELRIRIALQSLFRYHKDPTFLEHQQASAADHLF